eukprot:TRINITY_DN32996_c2_g1_i1.p1 TRINITY_DN32996_c2_g1~~TRINITY_DN32996_c2_g1_i1.p1  ORF type:complete len:110 (+),score=5.29 TRINITY_DN32996_c2_g1_i1:2092-2421(+)
MDGLKNHEHNVKQVDPPFSRCHSLICDDETPRYTHPQPYPFILQVISCKEIVLNLVEKSNFASSFSSIGFFPILCLILLFCVHQAAALPLNFMATNFTFFQSDISFYSK